MNYAPVHIRELAAWGLDEYEYRPGSYASNASLRAQSAPFEQANVVLETQTEALGGMLAPHAERPDLLAEMAGLSWSLGIVDLRPLLAFQRRLFFHPSVVPVQVPAAQDWAALIALCFGRTRPIECETAHDSSTGTLLFRSNNPNLHLRFTGNPTTPICLHTGSPFFEVACFRGRWFLRDGYHRAYALLTAGVFQIPAVIVHAATIEELGATQPWFFSEEVLFSEDPPRVTDFLKDQLVIAYERPPLIKTLRITMQETLTLAIPIGEPS